GEAGAGGEDPRPGAPHGSLRRFVARHRHAGRDRPRRLRRPRLLAAYRGDDRGRQAVREARGGSPRSGLHGQGRRRSHRPGAARRVRRPRRRGLPPHGRGRGAVRVPTGPARLMAAGAADASGAAATTARAEVGRRPLVGILGGLGPAATVDFYAKVVAATRAASDQDHVRLIIDGDPSVPDRSASVSGRGESSAPALVAKARRLAAAGAEVLAMPCNSAHAYEAEIRQAVDLPFISIVDEAVREAL